MAAASVSLRQCYEISERDNNFQPPKNFWAAQKVGPAIFFTIVRRDPFSFRDGISKFRVPYLLFLTRPIKNL